MNEEEKRVYRGLFLANFLIALGFGIADPFLPVYAVSNGATAFQLALIFSGYGIAKTLVSPLTGWWSDRRGRRRLILCGLFLYLVISASYLALPVPGPFVLLALKFFQGVAAAMVRPISLALVGDIAPANGEGAAMGTFDISFYAALAIGPVIGGLAKDLVGFVGLFTLLSVLCALSFLAALFFVAALPNKVTERASVDLSSLKKSKILVGLSGFIFARSFGITLFAVFVPVFMYENLKLKGIEMGIIMGAATVVTALLLKPIGHLSDQFKRYWLVTVGGSAAALLTLCIPMAGSFLDLFLMSISIGVFSVLSLPASSALLVGEGNAYGMGLTIGVFNGAMNLAAVLAPLAGGTILCLFGISALFYTGGIVGLLGTIFFSFYVGTVEVKRSSLRL